MDIDHVVSALASSQHGCFTAAQLDRLGISRHQRATRVGRGSWVTPYRGVYTIAGTPPSWRGDLAAAVLSARRDDAVASHRAAAELWALPGRSDSLVEITCRHWERVLREGLVVHESRVLPPCDRTTRTGIRVTTVARTLFDLCSVRPIGTVDLAIDNALRRDLTSLAELLDVLARLGRRGRAGTRVFRTLLEQRDPALQLTESEAESMLRRAIRRAGLPEPTPQHEIRDASGRIVARVDFAYPDAKVVIEYDSFEHHVGRQVLVRDSRRRNAIAALGWTTLVATGADLGRGGAPALVASIRRSLTSRPLTDPTPFLRIYCRDSRQ